MATFAYIKMNFDRSMCDFVGELLKSIMEMKLEIIPHDFDSKVMLARWETLKTNTVFGKIKYLISAAMTLPVFDAWTSLHLESFWV
jgi:hypothetical protein